MNRSLRVGAALLSLTGWLSNPLAADDGGAVGEPALAAVGHPGGAAAGADEPAAPPAAAEAADLCGLEADPIEVAAGSCTATCQDGSTRTCTGTSCVAVDASCPSQQGYCWSNSGGYKHCLACTGENPICSTAVLCRPCSGGDAGVECSNGLVCTLGGCGRIAAWMY